MTSRDVPLRAVDALHFALAWASRAEKVVTYDLRMAAGAKHLVLIARPRPPGEIR
jgi:hypothetical protein